MVACFVLVRFRHRAQYIKLIGLIFFLGFLTHMIGFNTNQITRNLSQSFYAILQFVILAIAYNSVLKKKYHYYFLTSGILFLAFALSNLMFIEKQDFNSYTFAASSFFILGFSIFYFYRLMSELPAAHLQRMPMFWINSGLLIYCAGALLLFIFRPYLILVLNDDLLLYWTFHNGLSIIEHILVLIGIYFELNVIKLRTEFTNNRDKN